MKYMGDGIFRKCEGCREQKMLYPEYKLFNEWYCYSCYKDESVVDDAEEHFDKHGFLYL